MFLFCGLLYPRSRSLHIEAFSTFQELFCGAPMLLLGLPYKFSPVGTLSANARLTLNFF
jgi:hypothetical protein